MISPILVTGGTGTLGRLVVDRLRVAGHGVRVLSRAPREFGNGVEQVTGDLSKNEGIARAVEGARIVVHCAGGPKGDDEATRNLVNAASEAGVQHLVYISVVGADRIPVVSGIDRAMFGYYAAKHAAEQIVTDSGLPWTILRATQFHQLLALVAEKMAKLPMIPFPSGFRVQPIDAAEVADQLVDLALGPASGNVPDMAGPKVHAANELLASYLRACASRRMLVPVWLPGQAARAFRQGANLAPERAVGQRTWEQFLRVRSEEAS